MTWASSWLYDHVGLAARPHDKDEGGKRDHEARQGTAHEVAKVAANHKRKVAECAAHEAHYADYGQPARDACLLDQFVAYDARSLGKSM